MLQIFSRFKIFGLLLILITIPKVAIAEDKKLVVTTSLLGDLVKEISQGAIEPIILMGPGVDPHLYQMTPKDSKELLSASLILFQGLHLEGRIDEMLRKLPTAKAVAEAIPENELRHVEAGAVDPHVWFNVLLWVYVGERVKDVLIEHYGNQNFEKNWIEYKKKLISLNDEVTKCIATIPQNFRVLITAHDAFSYFGKAYNIEVMGIQGISTESEVGLSGVMNVVNVITERKIPSVFIESTISRKSIDALLEGAARKGHTVSLGGELYSDALGDEKSGAGTYLLMVKRNALTITNALGGSCS